MFIVLQKIHRHILSVYFYLIFILNNSRMCVFGQYMVEIVCMFWIKNGCENYFLVGIHWTWWLSSGCPLWCNCGQFWLWHFYFPVWNEFCWLCLANRTSFSLFWCWGNSSLFLNLFSFKEASFEFNKSMCCRFCCCITREL